MGFFKKLSRLFAAPGSRSVYPVVVKCNRCGEVLHGQVNMVNELSLSEGEDADAEWYCCRKVLMGSQRCFQQIEVELRFDKDRQLVDRQITGGQFVDG
jgi:hypothetical protein